ERGMTFTEAHKCFTILSSLDSSWETLVSLENMQEQDLTINFLSGRLLEEVQRRCEMSEDNVSVVNQHKQRESAVATNLHEKALTVRRCFVCQSTSH
ncbi:hypothetical protein JRQ81_004898, partial [Phrynocephalus forsythii]